MNVYGGLMISAVEKSIAPFTPGQHPREGRVHLEGMVVEAVALVLYLESGVSCPG